MPTNKDRAERARKALEVYVELNCNDDDPSASITDLVTDLIHLTDEYSLAFDDITDMAWMHYGAEIDGEQHDQRTAR